ncbi:MAG: hypothetical protein OEY56_12450 [Cyclobacteriaceae bacterium]|nr:hypothetical protein [Cyclobacteriaceae bacterium]
MKTIGLLASMLLFFVANVAAQGVKIEKEINQSFRVGKDAKVDIVNKYGEVIVHTWYKDSVRIKVNVMARGNNQEAVDRDMGRVDVSLRQIGSIISGTTKFDQGKSRGLLGDILTQIEDYSKSIVGGTTFSINYELWMPAEANLSIENKYGDIYLETLTGNVSIDLSNGDLRGNRIENRLFIRHSFGKMRFDYIREGNLIFRGVECLLSEGGNLSFESSSSELMLGKVEYLRINSRNDKYIIEQATNVLGEGSFTDLRLDHTIASVRLDFAYGEIHLSGIAKDFKSILLSGKSCDFTLLLHQASYIRAKITGDEDQMILPTSMLAMHRETPEGETTISLSGFVGNTNAQISELEINASGGDLIISIQETDKFTNR